ncbi:MAG TPA: threonylcarbamoyl-AMP synthase [bacterium (Candidatus Stahlbacteria)]|nr:threonylcarbamoyl-AMP synthase [Candidatus Stahlbacteria bacterium]
MQIIKLRDKALFTRLKKILDNGKIAAIPTDTVYGLISRLKADTVARLARIKGSSGQRFAVMVSNREAIKGLTRLITKTQKKVIEKILPGKITVILKAKTQLPVTYNGTLGIRIPAAEWLKEFLTFYNEPIVATSANHHDEPPLRDITELKREFPKLPLLVDGGEIDHRPSTVIDLTHYPPRILRIGALPIFNIEMVIKKKVKIDPDVYFSILVVCTGNSCRSPMAVGILRNLLRGLPVFVYSSGTVADLGLPAADNAILALREREIDISSHQSQPLSRELVIRSDLILVMEKNHKEKVIILDPEARTKTFLLKDFPRNRDEIFDPVGRPLNVYKRCLRLMLPGLEKVASFIRKRYQ